MAFQKPGFPPSCFLLGALETQCLLSLHFFFTPETSIVAAVLDWLWTPSIDGVPGNQSRILRPSVQSCVALVVHTLCQPFSDGTEDVCVGLSGAACCHLLRAGWNHWQELITQEVNELLQIAVSRSTVGRDETDPCAGALSTMSATACFKLLAESLSLQLFEDRLCGTLHPPLPVSLSFSLSSLALSVNQ